MFKKLSIIALAIFISPSVALAQSSPAITGEDISAITTFELTPAVPGPNQDVTIYIDGSGLDFNNATLTWSVNGAEVKSGKGERAITIKTGNVGTNTTIRLTINADGQILNRSITISPGSVDMLWQSDGYVPPFYEGKSLWTKQGNVTVTAIPRIVQGGRELSRSGLIYKWSQNGTVLGTSSGVGRNSISLSDSILSLPQDIKVEIFTDRDNVVAQGSLRLTAGIPKVLVYENHPLYGILFNQEVGNILKINKDEITFAAFPYFFNTDDRNSANILYSWKTNSQNDQSNGSQVTYRTPEDSGGSSTVRVDVKHQVDILQSAFKDFLVQFGGNNSL